MNAPIMPQSVTNVPPAQLNSPLQPMPTVTPMSHPGNMPGGMPVPQPNAPQMGNPGANPAPYVSEVQADGTIAVRATSSNGSPGPVLKVYPAPFKQKQPEAPVPPGMPG